MTRGRDSRRHLSLVLALTTLLLGACIFSPPKPIKPPEPLRPYPVLASEDSLIETLSLVYQRKDYDKLQELLANDGDAKYQFFFYGPGGTVEQWDLTTELRIHQRMFQPESPPPGTEPVPTELWLVSVSIKLTPQTSWTERTDLYRDPGNPSSTGLDPTKWKVTEATYRASVFFQMLGETSYIVDDQQSLQSFLVVNDLAKTAGPGKFMFFRWQDLQPSPTKPAGAERPV